jgi:hypothetical protein
MQLANQTRIEIIRAELLRSFLGDIYIETAELVISNSGYKRIYTQKTDSIKPGDTEYR